MGQRFRIMMDYFRRGRLLFIIIITLGTACTSQVEPNAPTGVPRLIGQETLVPGTATPLRLPTATVPPQVTLQDTAIASKKGTPKRTSSGFVTVTPPPTLTPTQTSTSTPTRTLTLTPSITPSRTPSPTITLSPTATVTASPTFTLSPQQLSLTPRACTYRWFFFPAPTLCPESSPVSSTASYQVFQGGLMIDVKSQRIIYILYNVPRPRAWAFAIDTYMPGETIASVAATPPPGTLKPDFSFGKLWANDVSLRNQLGWATTVQMTYTAVVQVEEITGNRYLSGFGGEIFALSKDQSAWWRER